MEEKARWVFDFFASTHSFQIFGGAKNIYFEYVLNI